MKGVTHNNLITQLQKFLDDTSLPGSILTTRIIKKRIRNLDVTHLLKQSYIEYVKARGNSEELNLADFDKIAYFIKYLPGYYQTTNYKRRVGTGVNVTHIIVKQNKIKITE